MAPCSQLTPPAPRTGVDWARTLLDTYGKQRPASSIASTVHRARESGKCYSISPDGELTLRHVNTTRATLITHNQPDSADAITILK